MKESARSKTVQLVEQCSSNNPVLREQAVTELWSLALDSPAQRRLALVGIRACAGDPEDLVPNQAFEALYQLGNRNDARRLRVGLSDEYWVARASAVDSLGRIGGRPALKHVARVMSEDPEEVVRGWAAASLGENGDEREIPLLVAQLQVEASQRARVGILSSLVRLGRPEHLLSLVKLVRKNDWHVIADSAMKHLQELLDAECIPATLSLAVRDELSKYVEDNNVIQWRREKAQGLIDRLPK
jgi:HEAT repeat protein